MFEEEEDINCPYDNVEFPINRQPGTGTWPRQGASGVASPSSSSTPLSSSSSTNPPSGGAKFYGQHSLSRAAALNRLAPLVEVEGSESNDSLRLHDGGGNNNNNSSNNNSSSRINNVLVAVSKSSASSTSSASSSSFSTSSTLSSTQAQSNPPLHTKTPAFGSKGMGVFPETPATTTTGSGSGMGITSTVTTGKTGSHGSFPSTTNSVTSSVASATTTVVSSSSSVTPTSSAKVSVSSANSTASVSSNSKQTTAKPVIPVNNDLNLYMATQVTSPNDSTLKKKTSSMKYLDAEDEDFKRQDLNPGSRLALERVYTCHPDYYQLNSKILDEGSLLKQDVLEIFRKTGESLTYEQLLQGMLVDGERFLLGSCWLYYLHVQFLDVEGKKILREPYGRGRIGLTSKRALFLSTETFTDANLEPYGDPTKRKDGGYKLEVSKQSNIVFKNIPLSNFHSAEMEIVSGTSVLTKITRKAMCFGCFGTSSNQWEATPPTTRSVNSRVLRLGVSMPPWQTRMFMDVYLDAAMSLTVARDFISQLHSFAPHMH